MRFLFKTILLIAEFCAVCMQADGAVGMSQLYIQHPDGQQGWGSAVCVGRTVDENEWLFLTVKHNFDGVQRGRDSVRVAIRGEWVPVDRWLLHPSDDVAVCYVNSEHDLNYATIAADVPKSGEFVEAAGYPEGGALKTRNGKWGNGIAVIPQGVIPGDSGGGLFNQQNELVGIIVGFDNQRRADTIVTTCRRIRQWYQQRGWPCPGSCPVQPPVIDVPAQPPPQPAPTPTDLSGVWQAIDDLRAEVAAIPECRDGVDGAQGPRGENGPPGDTGPQGRQGPSGPGVSRLWLDGGTLWCEYTSGVQESLGTIEIPTGEFAFTVVFEAGDEAGEEEQSYVVSNGGTLRIPPQVLRIRNVNSDGEQLGEAYLDSAPLGEELKIRFRPPLEASQHAGN